MNGYGDGLQGDGHGNGYGSGHGYGNINGNSNLYGLCDGSGFSRGNGRIGVFNIEHRLYCYSLILRLP